MFIEEVTKVNDMVYGHQAELKKPKYKDIDLWSTGWQKISVAVPPANNSTATLDDIKKIQQLLKNTTPEIKRQYVDCDEDGSYYIKAYLEENNLDFEDATIEYIERQCSPVVRHFKNFFNRPRPYQLAAALKMDFKPFVTPTAKTPAYPSGHAVQSRVVANYYASLYPDHRKELHEAAHTCGWGRVEAGLHYPSDYTAGLQLADDLMGYMRMEKLNEDAPVNATGSAISMPTTMKRKRDKRFYELWTRKPK